MKKKVDIQHKMQSGLFFFFVLAFPPYPQRQPPSLWKKKTRSQSTLGRPPPKLACSNARNQKRVYRGTYVPVDKKFYPHLQSVVDRFMCYAKSKSSGAVVGKVYERGFFCSTTSKANWLASDLQKCGFFFPPSVFLCGEWGEAGGCVFFLLFSQFLCTS